MIDVALLHATISTRTTEHGPVIEIQFGPDDYDARDKVFDFLTDMAEDDVE